tara:strand:+ start:4082 stop:4564 length:483 start_codon:yes stop_codon:yes gene_type:complete
MGFDLSGIKPCHPDSVPCDEPTSSPWDGDGSKQSWKAYWAWIENTPGAYFRNNVWYWRPLWTYICQECEDILSLQDMERGSYNDFHEISKEKAVKIADKLEELLNEGKVKIYAEEYEKERKELEDSEEKDVKFMSNYPFNIDNVKNFAEFARYSGGFKIG